MAATKYPLGAAVTFVTTGQVFMLTEKLGLAFAIGVVDIDRHAGRHRGAALVRDLDRDGTRTAARRGRPGGTHAVAFAKVPQVACHWKVRVSCLFGSCAATLTDTWAPGTTLVAPMTSESITGTAFSNGTGGVACWP